MVQWQIYGDQELRMRTQRASTVALEFSTRFAARWTSHESRDRTSKSKSGDETAHFNGLKSRTGSGGRRWYSTQPPTLDPLQQHPLLVPTAPRRRARPGRGTVTAAESLGDRVPAMCLLPLSLRPLETSRARRRMTPRGSSRTPWSRLRSQYRVACLEPRVRRNGGDWQSFAVGQAVHLAVGAWRWARRRRVGGAWCGGNRKHVLGAAFAACLDSSLSR